MINGLNRVVDLIENVLVTTLILSATLIAIVQVIARYVFNNSLYWSEEFILYSLITMSLLSSGVYIAWEMCDLPTLIFLASFHFA